MVAKENTMGPGGPGSTPSWASRGGSPVFRLPSPVSHQDQPQVERAEVGLPSSVCRFLSPVSRQDQPQVELVEIAAFQHFE